MPSLVLNSPRGVLRETGPLPEEQEPLRLEAQRFFACIRAAALPRRAGAELALVVTQILDRVRQGQRCVRKRENCESAVATSF